MSPSKGQSRAGDRPPSALPRSRRRPLSELLAGDGRPVLIGEAPSRTADGLEGRSGRRLAELAGVPDLSGFLRVNLFPSWPGLDGKGTPFDLARARRRADSLRAALAGRPAVVLLGRRVGAAFGIDHAAYSEWREPDEKVPARHAIVPHPSGINRTLNDPEARRRAGEILRDAEGKETNG